MKEFAFSVGHLGRFAVLAGFLGVLLDQLFEVPPISARSLLWIFVLGVLLILPAAITWYIAERIPERKREQEWASLDKARGIAWEADAARRRLHAQDIIA